MAELAEWLLSMVRRTPPMPDLIVEKSTPVVSFGDFRNASIATLGINPSNLEFEDRGGNLLIGGNRRLATIDLSSATRFSTLTDPQVEQIIDECNRYFQVNPYRSWFKTLDDVIRPALQASYFDGTACHLDLVQWATKQKWSALNSESKTALLNDGRPHLNNQLTKSNIKLVVVNGRSVWNEIEAAGLGKPENIGSLSFGTKNTSCQLFQCDFANVRFVGWTANLQSQHGAKSPKFLADLALWLRSQI
jgi:hypothetical protein